MTRENAAHILEEGAWWDSLDADMSDADFEPFAEALNTAIEVLRAQQEQERNKPLTINELRHMAGEPVYCLELQCWGIVKVETTGKWINKPFLVGVFGGVLNFEHEIKKRRYTLYRYKPENVWGIKYEERRDNQ